MPVRKMLITGVVVVFLSVYASNITAQVPANIYRVGTIDTVFSPELNEKRKILISVPEKYDGSPEKKYPVVYVLDGDTHFLYVSGLVRQLALNSLSPEMIVVAIPNTDRTRDLTPTHVAHISGDSAWAKYTGGAETFIKFIENQLIPYVNSHYPANNYRTLIGHSFGGIFVMHLLRYHPELFNNYLSVDPSLWWDEQGQLRESLNWLDTAKLKNKYLYVAIANTMSKGQRFEDMPKDTSRSTVHIRSIIEFVNKAKSKKVEGLTFNSKYYPDDDHGSVNMPAEHDAIRDMFSWFKFTGGDQKYFEDSTLTVTAIVKRITDHYDNVSANMGYTVKPPADMVNQYGYAFMRRSAYPKALALFELNRKNYPNSASPYETLGEYYERQTDTAKAIENYTKAIELGAGKRIQEKLDKLKKK